MVSWLQEVALTLYTRAEVVNDFFLLHGVTATWATTKQVQGPHSQVIHYHQVLPCLEPDVGDAALQHLLLLLLAVWLCRDCPSLTRPLPALDRELPQLRQDTLALGSGTDEHVIKLVQVPKTLPTPSSLHDPQVCLELAETRPQQERRTLCSQAASTVLDNKLVI